MALLVSLHLDAERQGPGSDAQTRQALAHTGLDLDSDLAVADLGCGTGASTLVLARELSKARITAVDFLPAFVQRLSQRASQAGLGQRITPWVGSMEAPPFPEESLDLIWSEGAIYNLGFEKGVRLWRPLLKPGAVLAVTELTWLTLDRPEELTAYWVAQYPEVATTAEKLAVLERNGYRPRACFVLPHDCWLQNYYRPMQQRWAAFLQTHHHSPQARSVVAAEEQEMALYERHRDQMGYVFYVAQRL